MIGLSASGSSTLDRSQYLLQAAPTMNGYDSSLWRPEGFLMIQHQVRRPE